ncbi:hypothetical protein PY310_05305 [Pseudarthrobacter sp. H3Y2-7]|uniref:hypothetical protein n=1 Tax=Pseudarthrobacter naphthalenicus TaxID=3031328 RepID=UPI0023B02DF0|nr:hypothetical protein [Pseudarthrobacter sp. H3Y2-7]MDE8668000.1 hypothetical protein [Pseudarthrobacter sp. H3Y2-7]
MTRPGVTPRYYAWKDNCKADTRGIALWGKTGLIAHLTYTEARRLADKLHDMADRLEATEQPKENK